MVEPTNDSRLPSPGVRRSLKPTDPRASGLRSGVGQGKPVATMTSESLFKLVYRSRWILLICVVLALAAGFVYIEMTVPIYRSQARLYLDYGGVPMIRSYEQGRVPRTDRYLHTQAELLTSRPILGTVLESPEIRSLRTFANMGSPIGYLRRNLRVSVGKRDEIISVSFSSPYAADTAQIVNAVADVYMASRSDHEQQSSAQVLKILQDEMGQATKELSDKRAELEDFQSNGMPLSLGSDQGSDVVPRYHELQGLYTRAQISTREKASFLDGVRELASDPNALRQYLLAKGQVSAHIGAAGEKAPLEAELARVQSEKVALMVDLTANNPRIAILEAEMERIRARLQAVDDRFVAAALAAADQQYREAKSYEEAVTKLYDDQRKEVLKLNAELSTYRTLYSQVSQLEGYCQTVEQQIREIRRIVGEDIGQLRMALLEPALMPRSPSEPQKDRVMAVAMVLGLLMGGMLAVLRDLLDQTLRSTDEISGLLGLPVLGVVPSMARRQKTPIRGQCVRLQPDSPEAEAFRTIRTAVFFGAPKEEARTILITSPAAGDGKSMLASNLAIAMAQAGQKTVLVDADLRKPMQGVIFGRNHHDQGVSSVLSGDSKLGEAIQSTPVRGLSLLPCGPHVPNPAETLNSGRFAQVLRRLAEVYDRVLIDAPPVTVVADSQILGALCDGTILVLRAEKSTRKLSLRAIDALGSVGARLLGAVVNDVRRGGDRYGYYGTYGGSGGSNGSGRGGAKVGKARGAQSRVGGRQSAVGLPLQGAESSSARR